MKSKIIMIGSIPPPYHGSNIYFSILLNSKVKDHFDVSHLDISDHRNLDNLSKLDFTNVYLALKNLFMLFLLIRKVNPELIYIPVASNFLPYLRDGLFILISSFFSKAEIVIHLHEGNYFREVFYKNSGSLYKKFIEFSLSKVNTAIVYSDNLKSNFKGLVKNIVAFPNGLKNDSSYHHKKIIKNNNENFQISYIGNLFESKGILDILNAAVILSEKNINATFNFAGAWLKEEEQIKRKAENLIRENIVSPVVKFHGVLTGRNKDNFLMEADIFLFPTWYPYEGCPLVILEAMANSKPVISTKNIGAIPEMVIEGETGILIDPKNPEQLADAILRLMENSELRNKMGENGRVRFEERFTEEINTENIISTFKKVIN